MCLCFLCFVSAQLDERQCEMEAERQKAELLFSQQQEEMQKKQEELERKLVEQQQIAQTLRNKREVRHRAHCHCSTIIYFLKMIIFQ